MNENEINSMLGDAYSLLPYIDVNLMASDLYESQLNYNNADISSGQRCFTKDQIIEMIEDKIRCRN